jgi:hypothetical protein
LSSRRALTAALLLGCALAAGGCGGGDDGGPDQPPAPTPGEAFPDPGGRSLAEMRKRFGEGGPVLAPSVSTLQVGRNRFGFGLFDRSRDEVSDADAVVYVAPVGGGPASGPYPASAESLRVEEGYRSHGSNDDNTTTTMYSAALTFERPGRYEVLGMARLDDRLVAATSSVAEFTVMKDDPVLDVGERAPKVHTPTLEELGDDVDSIDTRTPPSTMHEADLAEVLGRRPAVMLFAHLSPCEAGVCVSVVDVAEQVKAKWGERVEFVYMDAYKNHDPQQGFAPQAEAWGLGTEPWAFTIDRRGRVAARLEGAFGTRELSAAVEQALERESGAG